MVRIGLALGGAVALAAVSPLLSPGRGSEPVAVAHVLDADREPPRLAEAGVLDACLGQKGARQAAKCVGQVAETCLKAPAGSEAECHRREASAWWVVAEEYRTKLEKRLVVDPKRLAELREDQRAWLAERARRCAAAPAACEMKETGRRALQLRLIAEQAGVAP